jgi:hypothetical protein
MKKTKPTAAAPNLVALLQVAARGTDDQLVKRWVKKLIRRGEGAASTPAPLRKGVRR